MAGDEQAASCKPIEHPNKVVNKLTRVGTGEPQVKIAEETVPDFASGHEIKLPAHSMLTLELETPK